MRQRPAIAGADRRARAAVGRLRQPDGHRLVRVRLDSDPPQVAAAVDPARGRDVTARHLERRVAHPRVADTDPLAERHADAERGLPVVRLRHPPSKLAVSAGVSVFRIVPTACVPLLAKPAPEALLSTSVNVSPLSSSASSTIGTDTVFSSSPGAKVSVPLLDV